MTDYELIKTALEIAKKAHEGQKDKAGNDYIFHPVTVALLCGSAREKAVALLHDTIEDTDVTYEFLKEKMGSEIADAVDLLTNRDHSHNDSLYLDYVRSLKASGNKLALAVKRADLSMNMDLGRIENPTPRDIERIKTKYEPAIKIIDE